LSSVNLNTIEAMVREVLKEIIQEVHVPTKTGMPAPQLPPEVKPKPKKREKPLSRSDRKVRDEPKKREKPLSPSDRKARDADQAEKEVPKKEKKKKRKKKETIRAYEKASGSKFFEGNEDEEQ
jgi:hypothetical protein